MIHIELLDRKTYARINDFTCSIDQCPWADIRLWQTFAHVTVRVLLDS